jgi:hypothetical protein
MQMIENGHLHGNPHQLAEPRLRQDGLSGEAVNGLVSSTVLFAATWLSLATKLW